MSKVLPMITAHTGCDNTPVNSLESIEYAIASKADIFEIDVRMLSGGELILSHDAVTKSGGNAVLLKQVFELMQTHTAISVNCDLKESPCIDPLLRLADSYGIAKQRFIVTGSVSPLEINNFPHITTHAQVFMNIEELLAYIVYSKEYNITVPETSRCDLLKSLNIRPFNYAAEITSFFNEKDVAGVNMPYNDDTKDLFEIFLSQKIPVSVWTINDPAVQRTMFEKGVYNLTTRSLTSALKVRSEMF